jgi:hypothetical protein
MTSSRREDPAETARIEAAKQNTRLDAVARLVAALEKRVAELERLTVPRPDPRQSPGAEGELIVIHVNQAPQTERTP